MKPIKLQLKNCMNIVSEDATENLSFIFSLTGSCKLNDIHHQNYLKYLFKCIFHGKNCEKRRFCHVFINRNVKIKYFLADIFYFIS